MQIVIKMIFRLIMDFLFAFCGFGLGYKLGCKEKKTDTIIEADKEELSIWLGKRCEDCGNKKCKELGELPKGYDCALWQAESEVEDADSN